ncbi:MAG: glycoside hydrolase family 43 protein, partial [Bacteroidales bacterium]|nr:glycoside hydrolase family 43 protein [Bacteroidales bacterium]
MFIRSLIILVAAASTVVAVPPTTFNNPVIPGFYPDPSVCRVGDDYYLATSSFEWFPGIPIFHSKDLVNWKQIGHALDRPSQLKMVANKNSSGMWAPTIRYHEGKFYVTATGKQCGNNLYVVADKPEGPYSEPVFLKTPNGIDPSMFWDDDGRCWFTANRRPDPLEWPGHKIIYIQELDLAQGKLIGEPIDLTYGIEEGIRGTEAPHIYKINDVYYLITAEGMTWAGHMVCMYYSDKVTGPYKQVPKNPVLSHRDKPQSPIQHTGHADLVQTQHGDWWSVMLGVRKFDENYYLGRETFLTPVAFEGIQPVFNPGKNEILLMDQRPDLPWTPVAIDYSDNFESPKLKLFWNFLRTPMTTWHDLTSRPGWLGLHLRPETVKDVANPSLIARRFQHHRFNVTTKMTFTPKKDNEVAGLVAMQNDRYHYRLELGLKDGQQVLS